MAELDDAVKHDIGPTGPHVEVPAASAWPLVLSLGIVLTAAGAVMSPIFMVVGAALTVIGLGGWIVQLLPGRGHMAVALDERERRPRIIMPSTTRVKALRPGMAGYRMRLPEKVHPISAGIKGGIVGGVLMGVPALSYGILSGHGIWFPANLLAGTLVPGVNEMTSIELDQLHPGLLVLATVIHIVASIIVGLLYGVLLPTLPSFAGASLVWGGIVMPLLWTGASYGLMGVVNPVLEQRVDWPWFVASQVVFGIVASFVVQRSEQVYVMPAGGTRSPGPAEQRSPTDKESS